MVNARSLVAPVDAYKPKLDVLEAQGMPARVIYLTVQDLKKKIPVSDRQIRYYAEKASDQGIPVIWEEVEYWPEKLPLSGGWRFRIIIKN